MKPRLDTALENTEHHKGKRVKPISRPPTSSVATGLKKVRSRDADGSSSADAVAQVHQSENERIFAALFDN